MRKKKATECNRKVALASNQETVVSPKRNTRLASKKAREKAGAEAHLDWSRKMAACAVRESKNKSEARKKTNAKKIEEARRLCALKVGMRVSGQWTDEQGKGDWYDGVVKSVDYVNRTVFVEYDDGDTDDSVPWTNTSIIDDKAPPTDG